MKISRTQIIATLGPASNTEEVISRMIDHNMDIVRLNFSWGTHEEHEDLIFKVRSVSGSRGIVVPIIQDLSGPRIQDGSDHHFGGGSVITEKDKADIIFGVNLNIEYFAMSYVGSASDIVELRSILDRAGSTSKIIAKIERIEALDDIDEIIKVSDAIMIARGDLGKSIPIEKIPFVQHGLIKKCNESKRMVIVATEMMSSMIDNDVPSRADVTDVANAVLSGADAVMLSNETAVGKNPVVVIETMEKILVEAEGHVKSEYINL